jgi:hypothetical protein
MRWIRNTLALIAILSFLLWAISQFIIVRAAGPLVKDNFDTSLALLTGAGGFTITYGLWQRPFEPTESWTVFTGSFREEKNGKIPLRSRPDPLYLPELIYRGARISTPTGYPLFKYEADTVFINPYDGDAIIYTYKKLSFNLLLPAFLFGLWPTIALIRHIKRRHFTPGLCRKCEYDLRGSPSGVCPECGWKQADEVPQDADTPTDQSPI